MNFSAFLVSSVTLLAQYYANEYLQEDLVTSRKELLLSSSPAVPEIKTYDFIIVGGGTAGCLLASRLSEAGLYHVLLLEAGGNPPPQVSVPGYAEFFRHLPELIYQYYSVPQKRTSQAYNNGSVSVKAGKMLGGTSAINGMFFNRGSPKDYNEWANLSGDESWAYHNVLRHFKKLERYDGDFPNPAHHGTNGHLPVSKQKYAPGLQTWLSAGQELGYEHLDPNRPQPEQNSFSPIEFTRQNGRRISSYDAHLKNIETSRFNLKISRYSVANEIILDEANQKAIGVSYTRHGILHFVRASKEIIISAGTFGSPLLLLSSGIGPEGELRKIPGVVPKVNLPVGQTLIDHLIFPLKIFVTDQSHAYDPARNLTEGSLREYNDQGSGPLSSFFTTVGQGFATSTISTIEENQPNWPDIEFSLYAQHLSHFPLPDSPSHSHKENEMSIHEITYLARPRSVGSVKLNPGWLANEEVEEPLLIDFNFLSHPIDLRIAIEAINKSLEIFESTTAYKKVGARYPSEPIPGCDNLKFRSNAYWECYLLQMATTGNHGVATCRMGKQGDPKAVVDSKLKVLGIQGLRVIDASVMPTITNTNIQAAVYMIAEKVSEEILNEWSNNVSASGKYSSQTRAEL